MSDKVPKTGSAARNRRRSRELALSTLYACEVGVTGEWEVVLERIADTSALSAETKHYARDVVRKVLDSIGAIDKLLAIRAANWELKRMAAIDRNVLRLAVAELFFFSEVPFRVVIDEAVELAKMYGTDESGKFVNGIIDSIHKEMAKNPGLSGKEGLLHGTAPRTE